MNTPGALPHPLDAPASGEDFYRQASADYGAHEADRAAAPQASAAAAASGAELAPAPDAAALEAYRKPGAKFDLYAPGSKEPTMRGSFEDLLANKDKLGDHVVSVTGPDGVRAGVRVDKLEEALAEGYKPETLAEAHVRRFLADNQGIKGDVAAAMISFADELFLGAPGAYFDRTLSDYQRANIEALRKEHGFANAVGGVAGFGGSLLVGAPLFKGAATAGRAAGAVVERAAADALAGRLTQAGIEGAPTLAKALLASSAGAAAKLGTEAGLLAAPKAITEAMLGDPQAAAETLLYSIGGGAALGGLAPGARELFSRIRPAASAAVGASSAAAGEASSALDKLTNAYVDARGKGEGVKRSLARAYEEDAGKLARQEKVLDAHTKAITEAGNSVLRAEDALSEAAIQYKDSQMSKLVDPTKRIEQRAVGLEIWQETRKLVNFWKGTNAKGGLEGGVKTLDKWLKDFENQVGKAVMKGRATAHPEELYMLLDDLKRKVGKDAKFGKSMIAIPEAARSFDELYHSIRDKLQRTDVWGRAAEAQREVNAAYERALATKAKFEQHFMTEYDSVLGRPIDVFDPAKVHTYLSKVGTESNALVERSLSDYGSGLLQRADAIEKHYALTREQKDAVAAGRKALEKLGTTVDEARKGAAEIAQIRQMKAEEQGRGVGGFLGLATDVLTRPVATVERLGSLRRGVENVKQWGTLVAEQAMRRAGAELDKIPEALARLGASKPAVATLPAHVMARFLGSKSTATREEQYAELRDKLTAIAANPEAAAQRIGAVDFAHGGAPVVGAAYAQKQIEAYRYLLSTMPKAPRAPGAFTAPGDAWKPTNAELMAWERRLEVVEDPFVVFRHLETNTLTKEHVDTLRAVYPKLYEAMAGRILERATAPDAPVLPLRAREHLASLLGADLGAGTGPAAAARLQAHFAPAQPSNDGPPPARGGPAVKVPSLTTDTQRISA